MGMIVVRVRILVRSSRVRIGWEEVLG
jgi:hypothetical protein